MTQSKTCSKCKNCKLLTLFHNNKKSKDGKASWCKECQTIYNKPSAEYVAKANYSYFQKHKKAISNKRRLRYLSDIEFRISCILRNRLNKIIRGTLKNGSAVKDLGCSIEFLKNYLQSKFQPGMTWDNYGFGAGKWNIDHIVPLAHFDLQNTKDLLKSCHFSNLQPLWHKDNLRKSDKI